MYGPPVALSKDVFVASPRLHSLPQLVFGLSVSAQYFTKPEQADQFFKTMLRSRIGRWILAEQHLKLSDQSYAKGSVGVLSPKINTRSVVEKVIFPFCFVGTSFCFGLNIFFYFSCQTLSASKPHRGSVFTPLECVLRYGLVSVSPPLKPVLTGKLVDLNAAGADWSR